MRKYSEVRRLKRETIKIAKDLMYSDEVIKMLHDAKTESEIMRIMIDARRSLK